MFAIPKGPLSGRVRDLLVKVERRNKGCASLYSQFVSALWCLRCPRTVIRFATVLIRESWN